MLDATPTPAELTSLREIDAAADRLTAAIAAYGQEIDRADLASEIRTAISAAYQAGAQHAADAMQTAAANAVRSVALAAVAFDDETAHGGGAYPLASVLRAAMQEAV